MFQPLVIQRNVGIRVAEIGDAGLPKAGFAADTLVHTTPEPKTLDRERQLGRIAPHLAYPAPVSRRLLCSDQSLFAQGNGDATLNQRKRGRHADDAAADHDDVHMRRQLLRRDDKIGNNPGHVVLLETGTRKASRAGCAARAQRPGRSRKSRRRYQPAKSGTNQGLPE